MFEELFRQVAEVINGVLGQSEESGHGWSAEAFYEQVTVYSILFLVRKVCSSHGYAERIHMTLGSESPEKIGIVSLFVLLGKGVLKGWRKEVLDLGGQTCYFIYS